MEILILTDKIAALRRTPLFGKLDETQLRLLAERAVERRLIAGEILFVAGEEARGLYVVVSGAVRAYRTGADGREQVMHVERAGSSIAEVPVFDDGHYPSSVAAEERSVLLFIAKGDVRRLCVEHPQIALAALGVLAGRLRATAELVEALALREVGQRLARYLLTRARAGGVRDGGRLVLELAHTNSQIASRIGSVREVVSRTFARLQQDGLIELHNRRLVIRDERRLAAYAGEK